MFYEPHPETYEPGMPPAEPSALHFPWAETQRRLADASPEPSGRYGVQIELGEPAMDTMALHMMKLAPGLATAAYRTTANTIYAVVEGEGHSKVDDHHFDWHRGDVFVAPSWRAQSHESEAGASVFRVTDEPLMRKLGFLRTEAP
jgi:gentisate 1,2-dioxygenase